MRSFYFLPCAASEDMAEQPSPTSIIQRFKMIPDSAKATCHEPTEKDPERDMQQSTTELHGWRLYMVVVAIGLGIFLVQMETTIVGTSLVSITNDLSGLQDVSWIVTAYLITYSSCLTIISKLSDIFGRKSLITISFVTYIAFSIGCGLSQSIRVLIVLRALQGIGGGGIFAMCYVVFPEIVAPHLYAAYASYVAGIAAIASLLGPLLGGAICNSYTSSWRWIFWLNGPAGILALFLILTGLPKDFPFHNLSSDPSSNQGQAQSIGQKFQRVDFVGSLLLLGACVLLITGLEEGGTESSWTSALPLSAVIISIAMWICFIMWSRFISHRQTKVEAVFPWTLMLNRFAMGSLASTFFTGAVFLSLAVYLPQRFQLLNGSSPFLSGVYILPLTISGPLGGMITGLLLTKFRVPPLYIMVAGATLQLIGLALFGGQTTNNGIPGAIYGLQVVIGLGLGLIFTTSLLLVPMTVSKELTGR